MSGNGFTGRRMLVTGGAGGIGLACAQSFLQMGAQVVLIDHDADRLSQAQFSLTSEAGQLVCHVSSLADAQACRKAVAAAGGPVHGLVHLAGVFEPDATTPGDRSAWDRSLAINLTSAYEMVQAFNEAKDTSQTTHVVLCSSRAFQRGMAGRAAYAAAKGGVVGLVRSFARGLAPLTLVNGIAPGLILTPMTQSLVDTHGEQRLAEIPLGRFGTPEDVAGVVNFLCSPWARYVTGQLITVDGGVING